MTKLLEEAIAALAQLPESEQDSITTLILENIASEKMRQQALEKSHTEPAFKNGRMGEWANARITSP